MKIIIFVWKILVLIAITGVNVVAMEAPKLTGPDRLLIQAVKKNDIKAAEAALNKGAHVNVTRGASQAQPIHHAAYQGSLPMVQLLVRNGAHVNALTSLNTTPLHLAVAGGHATIVRWLVGHGAHMDAQERVTKTGSETRLPIEHTTKDKLTIAKWLIEHGASVNVQSEKSKLLLQNLFAKNPLLNALVFGTADDVERILKELYFSEGAQEGEVSQGGEIESLNEAFRLAASRPDRIRAVNFILDNRFLASLISVPSLRDGLIRAAMVGNVKAMQSIFAVLKGMITSMRESEKLLWNKALESAVFGASTRLHQSTLQHLFEESFILGLQPNFNSALNFVQNVLQSTQLSEEQRGLYRTVHELLNNAQMMTRTEALLRFGTPTTYLGRLQTEILAMIIAYITYQGRKES